jgi:peptide-methionine (S)-S-oxide reductase
MKRIILYAAAIFLFAGCVNGQSNGGGFASLPKPKEGEEVATFGGGCFWSMSEAQLKTQVMKR